VENPWRTLGGRTVYRNAWISVREDRVVRPDGSEGIYGVIEMRPSVGVLALDDAGRIALAGQWRYPHNKFTWEIPRGGSDEGETDLASVARRELREEAGLEARCWEPFGELDVNNGVTTDTEHLFIATGLSEVPPANGPEERITVRWFPMEEAVRMALSGDITECCTVAAILKLHARLLGGKNQP
jgi:8-oxo-dGTP pyrophosphatase MutT (NUDIX family)